jgi:signal transduction histidine kinase
MTIAPEELRALPLFAELDAATLADLAGDAEEILLETGDHLFREGDEATDFFVLLEGRLVTTRRLDGVEVVGMYHDAPGFLGAVMVLTGNPNLASSRALEPARVAAITGERFRELVHADERVEREVMQIFGPIYQRAGALEQQREKLAALGNMAAGLAHELNNPAAAARRSASELAEVLDALADVVAHFVESGLEREQAAQLVALQREARERASAFGALDAIDAADAEEAVLAWLEAHDVPEAWRPAPTFAAAGLDPEWLEGVARSAGPALPAAVEWLAASLSAQGLVDELHQSTGQISTLVGAVKEYAYMDQAPEQEVDIHDGLESTLTILGHKLKQGSVEVRRDYDRSLPRVTVHGSELNQVWTNLLANALDALDGSGTITITTAAEPGALLVTIADDGPGIPEEIQSRIFEPFFTTKPVGAGTGIGLEIAYRVVAEQHHGQLSVESRPGDTRFSVRLPLPG